mmetsp:Transcript_13533/g.29064  ORF Transcript_13533/g.29064 Transcript_13533/m.29064 type:complete len:210 (-) Transcript_13533:1115-1744(-)
MPAITCPNLGPNTTLKQVLRQWSPQHHPYRWLGINCIILFWSATLLLGILITIDDDDNDVEKIEVEWDYLLYNFGACAVWVVEVSFNLLDFNGYFDATTDRDKSLLEITISMEMEGAENRTKWEVITLYIEMAFAAYFFVDSMSIVFHFSLEEIQREAEGMPFDVCINMIAYAFMVYRQFVDLRNSRQDGEEKENSSSSTTEMQAVGVM